MTEREPDWDTVMEMRAEAERDARLSQQFNCSDAPEESCSDAGCPVHGDGDDPDWGDWAEDLYDDDKLGSWPEGGDG